MPLVPVLAAGSGCLGSACGAAFEAYEACYEAAMESAPLTSDQYCPDEDPLPDAYHACVEASYEAATCDAAGSGALAEALAACEVHLDPSATG